MANPKPDTVTDVAVATQIMGTMVQQNQAIVENFIEWLAFKADTTDEDQYAVMASIIGEIMQSANVAEALAERNAASAKDLINRPLILHGFDIREGSFEESEIPFYAALTMSAPGADGTRLVTCGGMKVLAILRKLEEFGEWPQLVMFTAKETKKGFTALSLVRATI
jgi:hypothetical protein